jgi:short-subunit dehydrogenase
MKYSKILIVGASSFIASKVLHSFDFGDSEVFLVSRKPAELPTLLGNKSANQVIIPNFQNEDSLEFMKQSMNLTKYDSLLIINFIGIFGTLNSAKEIDLAAFNLEFNQNVNPFLILSKILSGCESGLLISFSGAGVGGDNLEVASPSYLASKAAIAFLIEAFDNSNKKNGIRFSAVSPGAFASQMQEVVANSPEISVITPKRRQQALETLQTDADPTRLINLLNFLAQNPDLAGGRIWSANFDDIKTKEVSNGFGKLRRQI